MAKRKKRTKRNCRAVAPLELADHELDCAVIKRFRKDRNLPVIPDLPELPYVPSLYWEGEDFDGQYKEDGCPWIYTESWNYD